MNSFCIPKHYEEDLESILIPYGVIQDRWDNTQFCCSSERFRYHNCYFSFRIERIAKDIFTDFGHEPLVAM